MARATWLPLPPPPLEIFFVPRFLERDEAIRREPCEKYPWDGVGDVRPFGALEKKVIEGVY